jgi:TfoX/Sxy family transcriptional regulator of competence genes
MASIKWVKPSPSTLEYFERLAPGPPLETRRMFGLPSRFLNGYMLVGVFGNALMLHLSPTDRAECMAAGATPFKPMGREMKAYVAIAPGTFEDHDLKWWIVRGMRHIATLPPRIAGAPPPRKAKAPPAQTRKPKKTKAVTTSAKAKANSKSKTKTRPTSTRRVVVRPRATKALRTAAARPTKNSGTRQRAAKNTRLAAKKRSTRR